MHVRDLVWWSHIFQNPVWRPPPPCAMYCRTGILFLCCLAATVESFQGFFTSDGSVRIVLNSSTVDKVLWLWNNAAPYIDTWFYDASHVRSFLVNANFFKGFCEAQDLLTPYGRSRFLISTRKLLLDHGKNHSRVVRAPTSHWKWNEPSPTSISFRISAWGAKHFMPCGVLLINFDTRESYMNFLYNKSAFYEDLCHLKSKCFPVGTYLPITSSATFKLKFGSFYRNQQAMIVNEGVMVDGTVSEIIDALSLLKYYPSLNMNLNSNSELMCKYAKRSLCNFGLAGRSAVFRYLRSLPLPLYRMKELFLCSAMLNNTSFRIYFDVALPLYTYNEIYVHPEIIVIDPLAHIYIEDHLVSISEVMRDHWITYTILKYKFHIIISLITFFIIKFCLKERYYNFICFFFKCFFFVCVTCVCIYILIFVFERFVLRLFFLLLSHIQELIKSGNWYLYFPFSVIIYEYFTEIVQFISALALLLKWCLKVSKPT